MKKNTIVAALLLVTTTADAEPIDTDVEFDMYDPTGSLIYIDNVAFGFVDQDAGTWGVYSPQWFYGTNWTAHDGELYTEGSYSIDTVEGAPMHFTVNTGQVAGHILFNWGASTNIDIVNVWDINADGSLSYATVPGMSDGPFPGFKASFNLTSPGLIATPVPAAAWLFASGLLGLAGIARRRKAA